MGSMYRKGRSRRKTAWDGRTDLTETQSFIKDKFTAHYDERHHSLKDSGEDEMINSYVPTKCPFCGSPVFKKFGLSSNGIQRYRCRCGRTFLSTTGTIFDERRISISEWMEYCLNLFRHVSITADSWNNKNAFTTSRYWLQKLFLTLEDSQNGMILSGTVWLDETYYTVRSEDIVYHEDGNKLRGLSRNQICIGVAMDNSHTIFLVEGAGKPSQKKSYEIFKDHIAPGSTLIHDKEDAHTKLVRKLFLVSKAHSAKELNGLPDKDNPMYPVNHAHAILKRFLHAHSSFVRSDLQGYLDLFAFVTNPPGDMLEKVELVIEMAFKNPKLLRYRDYYSVNTGISERE